jgi:hypothetical protein
MSKTDFIGFRYMNAERGRYSGAMQCAAITFKTEGAK